MPPPLPATAMAGPSTLLHLPAATVVNQKSAGGGSGSSELPPVAGVPSAPVITECDTGEALPVKLIQGLKDFAFIELHWFLPASLLQTVLRATEEKVTNCHCQESLHHRPAVIPPLLPTDRPSTSAHLRTSTDVVFSVPSHARAKMADN